MNMKWNSRISFAFITTLLLIFSTACSSGGKPSNTTKDTTNSTEKVSTQTPTATSDTTEPVEIHIYVESSAISKKPEGSDPAALKEVQDYIAAQTGVKIIPMIPPKGAETEKLNVLLSSDEPLDWFKQYWDNYKQAIIPLNDLLEQHGQAILKAWPEAAWKMLTDSDGTIWGVPRIITTAPFPIWVRQDWLDKFDLELPTTIDEYEHILKVFHENDPDENGKDDTIGLLLDNTRYQYGLAGAFTEHGYANWLDPTDNKIKIAELQPGYVDFLAKLAEWYKKGYIYKETFSKFDIQELLKTNRIGTLDVWYSHLTVNAPIVKQSIPEMEYSFIRDIQGEKGTIQTVYPGLTEGMLIPKGSKNAESVIKVMNWQYEKLDNFLTAWYGIPDKHWRWVNEEERTFEILDNSYAGEFMMSLGLAMEGQFSTVDPLREKHTDFLNNHLSNFDNLKVAIDNTVVYDQQLRKERVPSYSDLERLRKEESVKFIMGARPISEFNKFIDELYAAGLDNYIHFLTDEYNKQQ